MASTKDTRQFAETTVSELARGQRAILPDTDGKARLVVHAEPTETPDGESGDFMVVSRVGAKDAIVPAATIVRVVLPSASCECGCGARTRSHFATGHDARHGAALVAVALGNEPQHEDSRAKGMTPEQAEAELANRGWTYKLDASRGKAEREVTKKAEAEAKKAARDEAIRLAKEAEQAANGDEQGEQPSEQEQPTSKRSRKAA